MEVLSERTARPFPLWRLHSGPQSWSVDQCPETPPEHLESSVTDAMRRSVVTHHRRRIKKIYHSMTGVIWLDRSLVRGPSFQISQAGPSSGGCAIRHGSSMSPCTQGHRRSQTKGPASCGASSIRENRAAVLPAPRQNGGDTEESLRRPVATYSPAKKSNQASPAKLARGSIRHASRVRCNEPSVLASPSRVRW